MPAQERDQEQQTQQATGCDQASEVPARSNHIEITATSNVFVRCFLNVFPRTTTDIGHGPIARAATISTSNSACNAILSRARPNSTAIVVVSGCGSPVPSSSAHCTSVSSSTHSTSVSGTHSTSESSGTHSASVSCSTTTTTIAS